jgi:hypothetical protein
MESDSDVESQSSINLDDILMANETKNFNIMCETDDNELSLKQSTATVEELHAEFENEVRNKFSYLLDTDLTKSDDDWVLDSGCGPHQMANCFGVVLSIFCTDGLSILSPSCTLLNVGIS